MKKPNIQNILVPIDFSDMSGPAIEATQSLANRFGAVVHLVHVHECHYLFEYMAPKMPVPAPMAAFREKLGHEAVRALRVLANKHGISEAHCYIQEGAPIFTEITKVARAIRADLIVMPTHGRTGLKHVFLGSTAERVLQHSSCPVWVNREKPGKRSGSIRTILVPVDFSQSSFQALEYAIGFAGQVAAKLVILHAVDFGYTFTADAYGTYDLPTLTEAARKGAERQMEKFVRRAKFRGVKFETAFKSGLPVWEISALAEQRDVDLIITATHGRTGLKHLLIGSVAEQVVRHACQPVLVVPSHPEVRAKKIKRSTKRIRSIGQTRTAPNAARMEPVII